MKNKFILEIICLMLFFPIHAGAWTVQNEIRNDRTSISLQWVQTSFAGCFESLPSSVWSERLIPRKVEVGKSLSRAKIRALRNKFA